MKKLCNDPLFYKDWRTSKWVSLLMTLAIFYLKVISVFHFLNLQKHWELINKEFIIDKMWFNKHLLMWDGELFVYSLILVALIVIVLFKGEKQNSTSDLLHSMPFKRKDVILSKIKVGFVAIIIPFLVNFLIMTIFYFKNRAYIGSVYSDIPKFYFIHLVFCLFFFTFLVFIQTIVGQYFAATIIAPIILMVPNVLVLYTIELIRIHNSLLYNNPRLLALNNLALKLIVYDITNTCEGSSTGYKYVYENFQIKIIVMVFLIAVFTILAVIMYSNVKLEKINELIIFKPMEIVFKLGVGICTGIVFSAVVGFNKQNITVMYITLLLSTAIGYFISKLMIKFCSK